MFYPCSTPRKQYLFSVFKLLFSSIKCSTFNNVFKYNRLINSITLSSGTMRIWFWFSWQFYLLLLPFSNHYFVNGFLDGIRCKLYIHIYCGRNGDSFWFSYFEQALCFVYYKVINNFFSFQFNFRFRLLSLNFNV